MSMFVKKRNGELEEVSFDKVTDRIKKLCYGLNMKYVNPVVVAQQVNVGMINEISTSKLDVLASQVAAGLCKIHPDYNILAGRIMVSNLQKEIKVTFSEAMEILYNYENPKTGKHAPVISEELYNIVKQNAEKLDKVIQHERDFCYDIFGIETLRRSYLLKHGDKIMETPQYMHLRVALGIHGEDIDAAIEMYHLLSERKYTHSSPTIFNSGTPRPQLASCFLLQLQDDSIDGIFDTLKQCAKISKFAGGIGVNIHNLRSTGSYIEGTNGTSSGVIPFLQIYNWTAKAVNQGGKRKGSFAMYLEPHHADIYEFIELRKPGGSDDFRCRDLFLAVWASELFFERVMSGGDWTLFDPNGALGLEEVYGDEYKELYERYEREGRGVKTVKAQALWTEICKAQIETGTPYLLNKDACNEKSNQKNLGTIKSSNLCVAPETKILTDTGYHQIADLVDQDVNVWNGEEWSSTTVRQTGTNQKLIKVNMSNGSTLECTPYHKFYIETGSRPADKSRPLKIDAKDLKPGMKLIKHELPIVEDPTAPDFPYAYTHGLFCSDGTYTNKSDTDKGNPLIQLYDEKKKLIEHLEIRSSSFKETARGTINVLLYNDIAEKFVVPTNYSIKSKLEWLAGVCDGDGTVSRNGTNESIQIGSIHKEYLDNIMYMLQTMGIHSKVTKNRDERQALLPDGNGDRKFYKCKASYRLLISSIDTQKLLVLGFSPNRLSITKNKPQRNARQFVKVLDIVDDGRCDNTYCFTEHKRGMGMFGGVLTGQCAEIIEHTSKDDVATCNLAQLNLSQFVDHDTYMDWHALVDIARHATRNLNKVIDRSFYPIEEAKNANFKNRPLGLGVSGLHDVFFKLKFDDFSCPEARKVNKNIFETIYRGAILESIELAKKYGPYETFEGSPASKGILQFDMWGIDEKDLFWDDWSEIKEQVKQHGLRNSLLIALMPTASSATIMGVTECFEIQTSNIYSRTVLSGDFTIINKYLIKELIEKDLWNEEMANSILSNDGSVQHIEDIPDDIKRRYKTVWEYSMKDVIDMAADRSAFVCQSSSLNLFIKEPSVPKLTSMHMYSFKKGLKTMSYYLRSRAATEAVKFTVRKTHKEEEEEECLACQA